MWARKHVCESELFYAIAILLLDFRRERCDIKYMETKQENISADVLDVTDSGIVGEYEGFHLIDSKSGFMETFNKLKKDIDSGSLVENSFYSFSREYHEDDGLYYSVTVRPTGNKNYSYSGMLWPAKHEDSFSLAVGRFYAPGKASQMVRDDECDTYLAYLQWLFCTEEFNRPTVQPELAVAV